jgi:hypothetical protein
MIHQVHNTCQACKKVGYCLVYGRNTLCHLCTFKKINEGEYINDIF